MIKIATPISHLFENNKYKDEIIKLSDCLECRDRSIDDKSYSQELFHCELQPIHEWHEEEWSYLEKIKNIKEDLKLISFHMASNCSDPIIEDGMFQIGGKIYTEEEMQTNAKYNFSKIKKIFGEDIAIAVENNNYYPSDAYAIITEGSFISKIVYENNLYFLFDIAHAKVTCYNKNINYEVYKNTLPLDKAIQLHICTYDIDYDRNMAYDAHLFPDDEELIEVKKNIEKYNIKYLTVEYYKDINNLKESLNKVRGLI